MDRTQKPALHNDWIDPSALEIVSQLQQQGFVSYLVGGCVRDLLLGIHPKDFDIVTDASPQQVKKIIRQSYIIGKRFRLVLVRRGPLQFEVATFRRNMRPDEFTEGDEPFGDNLFGTPEEDAIRRDFTVNALFYDPIQNELIDYSKGLTDISDRILRVIGDPDERMIEDSIRILRALRLAHKTGFCIEPGLRESMARQAHQLHKGVLPRRREEYLKILRLPEPQLTFLEAYDLKIVQEILPSLLPIFDSSKQTDIFYNYLTRAPKLIINSDDPSELFSVFVTAAVRASLGLDNEDPINSDDLEKQRWLDQLMREELGMFKYEQSAAIKTLQLQSQIRNIKSFKRKGPRRQLSFLANENFPLALRLAHGDNTLATNEAFFWYQTFEERRKEIAAKIREQ